jgi:hypothetical protein
MYASWVSSTTKIVRAALGLALVASLGFLYLVQSNAFDCPANGPGDCGGLFAQLITAVAAIGAVAAGIAAVADALRRRRR